MKTINFFKNYFFYTGKVYHYYINLIYYIYNNINVYYLPKECVSFSTNQIKKIKIQSKSYISYFLHVLFLHTKKLHKEVNYGIYKQTPEN